MGDKKVDEADPQNDLDYVLSDVGEFGKYQIFQCILMILPIILSATYAVEFIVTSSTDDYRQVHSKSRKKKHFFFHRIFVQKKKYRYSHRNRFIYKVFSTQRNTIRARDLERVTFAHTILFSQIENSQPE